MDNVRGASDKVDELGRISAPKSDVPEVDNARIAHKCLIAELVTDYASGKPFRDAHCVGIYLEESGASRQVVDWLAGQAVAVVRWKCQPNAKGLCERCVCAKQGNRNCSTLCKC